MYIYNRGGNPNLVNKYNQTPIAYGAKTLIQKLGLEEAYMTAPPKKEKTKDRFAALLEEKKVDELEFDNNIFFVQRTSKDLVSRSSTPGIAHKMNMARKKRTITDMSTARSLNPVSGSKMI